MNCNLTSKSLSSGGKIWKCLTQRPSWPGLERDDSILKASFPWRNGKDIHLELHYGQELPQPILVISNSGGESLRFNLVSHIIVDKELQILDTIPSHKACLDFELKHGACYSQFTRWSQKKVEGSVTILICIQAEKCTCLQDEVQRRISDHEEIFRKRYTMNSRPRRSDIQKRRPVKSIELLISQELLDQNLTDFNIKTSDGVLVPCNKFVFSVQSPVFKKMLWSPDCCWKESRENVVELPYEAAVVKLLVQFLYKGTLEAEYDMERLENLLQISHMYELFDLSKLVSERILRALSPSNLCLALLAFYRFESESYVKSCIEFLDLHLMQVAMQDPCWSQVHHEQNLYRMIHSATMLDPEWRIIKRAL